MASIDKDMVTKLLAARRSPAARIGAGLSGLASGYTDPAGTFKTLMAGKGGTSSVDTLAQVLLMQQMAKSAEDSKGDTITQPEIDSKDVPITGAGINISEPETVLQNPLSAKYLGKEVETVDSEKAWNKFKTEFDSAVDVEAATDKKQWDTLGKKYGEAGRVAQAMRGIIGYGKTMDEANIPNWQRELLQTDFFGSKVGFLPDEMQNRFAPVMNYISQLTETKVGALPIFSGQARYVVDLANAIAKTQGSAGINPKLRGDLAAQSLRNIMSLVYAMENGFITVDKLNELGIDENSTPDVRIEDGKQVLPEKVTSLLQSIKLTPEQEKDLEGSVDYLLSTPAIKGGKFVKDKGKKKSTNTGKLSSGLGYTVE